jgi:ribonuclease HII
MFQFEKEAKIKGFDLIAGVDEAGRGPLAGPVVAAAVVLKDFTPIPELRDSKEMSPNQRDRVFELIKKSALGFGIGVVDESTIEEINILQATLLAMKIATEKLPVPPDFILVDGNRTFDSPKEQKAIVKGDQLSQSIAAASVLAKVTRDRIMVEYHKSYPQYGFDKHKGYGTKLHKEMIREFKPCPIHRKTFKGVREFL